jgi:hypothetical protein
MFIRRQADLSIRFLPYLMARRSPYDGSNCASLVGDIIGTDRLVIVTNGVPYHYQIINQRNYR